MRYRDFHRICSAACWSRLVVRSTFGVRIRRCSNEKEFCYANAARNLNPTVEVLWERACPSTPITVHGLNIRSRWRILSQTLILSFLTSAFSFHLPQIYALISEFKNSRISTLCDLSIQGVEQGKAAYKIPDTTSSTKSYTEHQILFHILTNTGSLTSSRKLYC